MLRRVAALFRRKPKSPPRRNSPLRAAQSPRRSPAQRRAAQSPRRRNNVMVMYNGHIMTYNNMQKAKEVKRLERAGYSPKVARTIVNRHGVANRPSNRMGGMMN